MANQNEDEQIGAGGWTDGTKKVAMILFLLLLVGGIGLELASRSMEPPTTREEFRERNTLPPDHDPIFGEPQVSVGEDVAIAAHHAEVGDEHVTWRSTLLIRRDRDERSAAIKLARPLAPATTLVSSDPAGASFERNSDRYIVAIVPPPDMAADRERLMLTTRQADGDERAVQPPLVGDHVSQRITVSGAYYERGEDTPLTHWGLFRKTADVGYQQMEWIDDQLGEPPSHNGVPLYVRGHDHFFEDGGLSGRFVPWFRLWAVLGLLALIAAVVLGLALLVRRRQQ